MELQIYFAYFCLLFKIYQLAIIIEIEKINKDGDWEVVNTQYVRDMSRCAKQIERYKKIYALKNKSYRIFIKLGSKVNNIIEHIDISDFYYPND